MQPDKKTLSYFYSAFIVTFGLATLAFYLGGIRALWIVAVLGVLEVSLSFDNAVVNAVVLATMDEKWRKRFITWGMPIAVFGMRLLFPLGIVSAITGESPMYALDLAINNQEEYSRVLTSAHDKVMAFGGTFLLMVFLKFFMDAEKEHHWVPVLEGVLSKFGKVEAIQAGFVLLLILAFGLHFNTAEESVSFMAAAIAGLCTYIAVGSLEVLLGGEDTGAATTAVAKSGLASFLYLEVLDASFSFDGVIGAFALSNSLFIIACGLGIGAVFVRDLTLLMVDKGTLDALPHLEHGAFWAIGVLGGIMYVKVHHEIPETVTGLLGAGLIGLAAVTSVLARKKGHS